MNVTQHLERGAHHHAELIALQISEERWDYTDLNQAVNRFANWMRRQEVEVGDRIALFLPNSSAFVLGYLAALKIGAIAVSVNVMLKRNELTHILTDCEPRLLVTTDALRDELPTEAEIGIALEVISAETIPTLTQYASPYYNARKMGRDDPAAIVYTSGTTGFPKGATLSHGNIISNMHAKTRYCGMQPGDKLLLYMPLFHCFGQNAILNAGLNSGATIVLQDRFRLEDVLETVAAERITMLFGVPTVYKRLLECDLSQHDFSSVRYCFTAAALMPTEIAQAWYAQTGRIIYEGYGLTETSPFASYNHLPKFEFGSIGQPIERVEMRIVDEDGQPVADSEIGEIAIKGPNVMLGYWRNPEATATAIRDGWFHSGDLGMRTADGNFFLVDRLKNMVNVAGFNVYPAQVEQLLRQSDWIEEVATYGVPDIDRGEVLHAKVVLAAGCEVTSAELRAYCKQIMAAYKVPAFIELVASLPKTATGKIDRGRLRSEPSTAHN